MKSSYSEKGKALEEACSILAQLHFHHASQGKPHTDPPTKKYNNELAVKTKSALKSLRQVFGVIG